MAADQPMERAEVKEALGHAISLLSRSVLQGASLAAHISGLHAAELSHRLIGASQEDLQSLQQLLNKHVALVGQCQIAASRVGFEGDAQRALDLYVACESEALDALTSVIKHTGTEAEGEALEHALEHIIVEKQERLDFIRRASREEPLPLAVAPAPLSQPMTTPDGGTSQTSAKSTRQSSGRR